MNCLEFRHLILSDPYAKPSEAEAHLETCAQCRRFRQEVLDLDSDIEKALNIEVPEGLAARVLLNHSLQEQKPRRKWVQYAMAASVLMAVLFSVTFLNEQSSTITPSTKKILAHAAHQPHEFYGSEHQPLANEDVERLMASLQLTASIDNVVYAAICPVDGESAAHLVIKDGEDQYTVLLVPEHSPNKMFSVDDKLWRGFVSPHPAGALAVLAGANDTHAITRIREITNKLQSEIYLTAEI
tara:strand:- start:16455 stop:17177 length:723 start_codon:yes stop_codon:yes gene_type:complete